MRVSGIALASSLAFAAATLSGQGASQFAGKTTVVVVEVPVNVDADGQPVRGLTAASFEVLDRGEPRPLVGFEVVDLEAVAAAAPEVPVAARRHFLLLFDLSFTRAQGLARSLRAGRELLDAGLHPTDRVAVAVYGLAGGARLLLSFTSDRGQVNDVLDVLEGLVDRKAVASGRGRPRGGDPLRLMAADPSAVAAEIGRAAGAETTIAAQALADMGGGAGSGGRAPDLQGETLADMDEVESEGLRERRRSEALALAGSLGDLARQSRAIDGRKYLLFFSEGFEGYLLEGQGASAFIGQLRRTFEDFRRAGWAIQSVDAGGVRGLDDQLGTTASLALLAKETGGELFQNVNELGQAVEGLLAKTGVTYLLAFQTPEIALDGSFHPLEVRLKDAPRGAHVRHRSGYFAPAPDAEPDALERIFAAGDKLLSGEEGGDLAVAALVTPFKGAPGDGADLAVWIEVDGESLLAEPAGKGDDLETEAFVYAFDAHGEIRDFFTQKVVLDLAKTRKKLGKDGLLKLYGDLHVPAGDYDVRVLVRAGSHGRYGLSRVAATVADFSDPAPVLSSPVFFADPERPAVIVREADAGDQPFRIGTDSYYPAVRPALAMDHTARISLLAYHLPAGVRLQAMVVDGDGKPVERDRLAVAGKDRHDDLDQIFFDFKPAGLAAGDYTLRLELRDPATGASYARSAAFRLVAR